MKQTRICFNDVTKTQHLDVTITQENAIDPWYFKLHGWNNSLYVTLHHRHLKGGVYAFGVLNFKTSNEFAKFAYKMLTLFSKTFETPNMAVKGMDFRTLKEGYEKGLRESSEVYIEGCSLD